GIPISDRHRAQGDAQATLKLFQLLLEKDTQKQIIQTQITAFADPQLPQVHHKILDSLPTDKGVYYIYNSKKKLIYIGKSNNIRKRLLSHLTSKNSKSQKISAQLAQVSFEKTGSEAIALLKEQNEIKKNQPPLNRAAKQRLFPMGIRMETDTKGYLNLLVEQVRSDQTYLAVFKNKKASIQRLYKWIEKYQLCLNKTSLTNQKEHCTDYDLKKCEGACMQEEDSEHYNQKIERLTEDLRFPHTHFLITDYGRQKGEYSFILIKNQQFKGYGYYELNHQVITLDRIHSR
ncbi:MAG: GIY-YIG nuclease family protein, partial [Flavobacteriaceae bacterium]